jgi:DNA-binding MltR family transcriptional regulator
MADIPKPPLETLVKEAGHFYEQLNQQNDVACVVVSVAYIDACVRTVLRSYLVNCNAARNLLDHRGPLGSFSYRCDLAYCLGLIPKELLHNLKVLGDIRNLFAHSHLSTTFDDPKVSMLCGDLTLLKVAGQVIDGTTGESISVNQFPSVFRTSPRPRFILAVTLMASELFDAARVEHREVKTSGWTPSPRLPDDLPGTSKKN